MEEEYLYVMPYWFKNLMALFIQLKNGIATMDLETFQRIQPVVKNLSMNDFPRYKPFCERLWSPKKEVIENCINIAKLVFQKIEDNNELLNGNWKKLLDECEREIKNK